MRPRLAVMLLLSAMFLAAMWGAVARAQVTDTQLDVTEFQMEPFDLEPGTSLDVTPPTQAGGNPDVALFMRFCNQGLEIASVAPSADPQLGVYDVTTVSPHGVIPAYTMVRVRGVESIPAANGIWVAVPIEITPGSSNYDPLKFRLASQSAVATIDNTFAPDGQHVQIAPNWGCVGGQNESKLAEFKLSLPPGFLGNPTAVEACPTHLWIATSCPDRTIVGHSVTDAVVDSAQYTAPPFRTISLIYNVATLGLEPARLGTRGFPSDPAGPFPIKIDLRTEGDYGLDSALIDIPKNLGGVPATVIQIETVLCAQVPCKSRRRYGRTQRRSPAAHALVLPQPDLVQERSVNGRGALVGHGRDQGQLDRRQLHADRL